MDAHVLLAQMRSLLSRAPDFSVAKMPPEHMAWLAQAHALITRWNKYEAVSVKTATDFLMAGMNREYNIAQIFGALHRAVADIELKVPQGPDQAFGPGAVYDFFKALSQVVSSAKKSLMVVDPYMDDQIFDAYLSKVNTAVSVQLLVAKYSGNLKAAAAKFAAQHHLKLEVRSTKQIHDRLIFVDSEVCWVLGQSIKDAAAAKPTYLAPLSPDVAAAKVVQYEQVWEQASAI